MTKAEGKMTPFYDRDEITIWCGECSKIMSTWPGQTFDLTVTSPPYDDLRDYHGYTFDFELIAAQLLRVTKKGGVVVWVVGDMSKNHQESLTSFKQALRFSELGFNLLDTMIYRKAGAFYKHNHRVYPQAFEYMFIFSSGRPKTFNPIRDKPNSQAGKKVTGTKRKSDGKMKQEFNLGYVLSDVGMRDNVWTYNSGFMLSTTDKDAFQHPAIFPEALARDHIISWSNPGDLVLDPMCGSGTTLKMAQQLGRRCIGIDVSEDYCKIAVERLRQPTFWSLPSEAAEEPKHKQSRLLLPDSLGIT